MSCGIGAALETLDAKVQEAQSKIDEALADAEEGIAAALAEINAGIDSALSEANSALDGFASALDEAGDKLQTDILKLLAVLDDPTALAQEALALTEKYGDASGFDINEILEKIQSLDFDPCKDIPNIEKKADGTIVEKGANPKVPESSAAPLEPPPALVELAALFPPSTTNTVKSEPATVPDNAKPFTGSYSKETEKLTNINGKTYVVPK